MADSSPPRRRSSEPPRRREARAAAPRPLRSYLRADSMRRCPRRTTPVGHVRVARTALGCLDSRACAGTARRSGCVGDVGGTSCHARVGVQPCVTPHHTAACGPCGVTSALCSFASERSSTHGPFQTPAPACHPRPAAWRSGCSTRGEAGSTGTGSATSPRGACLLLWHMHPHELAIKQLLAALRLRRGGAAVC